MKDLDSLFRKSDIVLYKLTNKSEKINFNEKHWLGHYITKTGIIKVKPNFNGLSAENIKHSWLRPNPKTSQI